MINHKQNQYLTLPTFLFIILTLITFFNRYIESDECWLGEQSFSFLKMGYVRLKTIPGINGLAERNFVYHKLYTWMHAPVIGLFGWSITTLKICTLFVYVGFLASMRRFVLQNIKEDKHTVWVVVLFLFIVNPIVILKSFSFRPDILMMALGFYSFWFLDKSRIQDSWTGGFLSGLFAGLAVLTHLNGIAFALTGLFFLLSYKRWESVLAYCLVGGSISAIYFIDLLPAGNFDEFMYQLTNWPTVNHGANFIEGGVFGILEGRFIKLLHEQQRFFWSYKVTFFSVTFFFLLIAKFSFLKKNYGAYIRYFLILVLCTNVFGSHIAQRYLLFYFPIMGLLMSVSIHQIILEKKKWLIGGVFLLLGLQCFFSLYIISDILRRSYDYEIVHKKVLALIDDREAKILAPWELIYNDFERYDLYNYKTYEYTEDLNQLKLSPDDLLDLAAEKYRMNYVILQVGSKSEFWFPGNYFPENAHYEMQYKDDVFVVLKSKARAL